MLNRRDFLNRASLVGWGATVPAFLGRTALAAPTANKAGAKDTILVVVQLTGGNDGLNTVIPYKDSEYAKLRPTLKIGASEVHKVNDSIGLAPTMGGFNGLLQEGVLSIVQGVGYPNPSQSHFRSMDIWHTAGGDEDSVEGWLGKGLKGAKCGAFHLAAGNESAPLALAGAPARVPSVTSLEDFQLRTAAATGSARKDEKAIAANAAPGMMSPAPSRGPSMLDFVQRTALSTYASTDRLREIGRGYQPKSAYPGGGLSDRLKLAAQLISADLGARVFYVSTDGFDTHANQAASHPNLVRNVSDSITAFYKDLAARGMGKRVLVMTFSEFGRRAGENGSRGTDHGSGAPMFLVGGGVKPGLVGAHPSLTDLDDGNLKHHTDFRRVYAAVLERWLGVNAADVLGAGFKPADVLA